MRCAWLMTVCLGAALVSVLTGCQSAQQAVAENTGPRPIRIQEPTPEQQDRLQQASTAQQTGDYDNALDLFQEILSENPTITAAYLGIGDIYLIKEDYARAEPAFSRAARIEPGNFDAQYGHGVALQMLKRFVDAVRAYQRAVAIRPDSPKANLNLATTYLELTSPEQALPYAERAVRLDASNGPAHANLGFIYERLARNPEAIDEYIAALELMGNDPHLMLNLINVQAKERRYQEAANTAETLTRIEPTAPAFERLGWCHFKLRRYEQSMDAYKRTVELDAAYWPAHNGIGVNALNAWILSKKRDTAAKSEAGEAFRNSLRANPNQPKVIELLLNYNL